MIGLGLSKHLPAPVRDVLLWSVRLGNSLRRRILPAAKARSRLRALRRRAAPSWRGTHVVVLGFFGARIGLGEAADLLARDLAAAGSTVTKIDVTGLLGHSVMIERMDCAALDVLA